MGCEGSRSSPQSEAIDHQLKVERSNKNKTRLMHVLLLGSGNSGKSTFARQIYTHYHVKDETYDSLQGGLEVIRFNTMSSAKTLVSSLLAAKFQFPDAWNSARSQKLLESDTLTAEVVQDITLLFKIDAVKTAIKDHGDEMEFIAGASGALHFFSNCSKYLSDNYPPTFEDLLFARKKTTGIKQYNLFYEKNNFILIDVGGQESERRKWVSVFQDVDIVIFLVAVNEYDFGLEEDPKKNRMVDSLILWMNLTKCSALKDKTFVLFLNKIDLLPKKVAKSPVSKYFDGYDQFLATQPPKNSPSDHCLRFFRDQFLKKYAGTRKVTTHFVSSIDTKSCKKIWASLVQEVIERSLAGSNLI